MANFAHVHVGGGALGRQVADGAEEIETRRDDARRVPELTLRDLENRLTDLAAARREVPARDIGLAQPDDEVAVERNDHRELSRRGRVFAEGVVASRNECVLGHFPAHYARGEASVNSTNDSVPRAS